jgi:hypothetical protein
MGAIQFPRCEFDDGCRAEDGGGFDLDVPEVWPELEALIKNSEKLTELVARVAALVVRNVVKEP